MSLRGYKTSAAGHSLSGRTDIKMVIGTNFMSRNGKHIWPDDGDKQRVNFFPDGGTEGKHLPLKSRLMVC